MKAEEKASMLKALGLFCGYITLALVTCVVTYHTQAERVTASPKECTADPSSCPVRTFCYLRGLDAAEYFPGLFDARDASNNTIWDEATIDQDDQYEDGKLFGVCACYALYGEGGENPIPGGPAGSFCEESEGYRDIIMIALYVCLAITALSVFNQYMTMYALYRAEALLFNASGITMVLVALSATMESWLIIVYLIEIQGLSDPVYSFNDGVRPAIFGFFAVAEMGSLLEVSVMWADVYTKSKKMGADSDNVVKLKKFVAVIIVLSFFIVMGCLLTGLTMVAGAWAALVLIGISIGYWKGGSGLAAILMPSDPSAPGASSAKAAADQILKTSKAIPLVNFFFIICLGGHFVTVQRPATGPVSMICVFGFLIFAVVHQFRLLYYVKFGNRKKLTKAGYKGFRTALMSTMTATSTSSVAPDESTASTVQST
mmetsp:Transcript_1505/g.2726  ORF Transcript_1505/g.2726 Transcript_1505/m.2726 type:complete len:430 (-) Transcript_1505:93-1382(-)|eukprot:CAMPEP_0182474514 /NCGR_PEP_ID=MMETSP1319-20130603/25781_1 /TAXON_ID=172717 /ORGANISM="Bolidomonas pacifica, Strain RCC208" /LENGTH=429 /DNA_ID=CAMNT_0024675415 /DNA_START=40 /DNA_END=1329 /DNA_ORIENTATION=+